MNTFLRGMKTQSKFELICASTARIGLWCGGVAEEGECIREKRKGALQLADSLADGLRSNLTARQMGTKATTTKTMQREPLQAKSPYPTRQTC